MELIFIEILMELIFWLYSICASSVMIIQWVLNQIVMILLLAVITLLLNYLLIEWLIHTILDLLQIILPFVDLAL